METKKYDMQKHAKWRILIGNILFISGVLLEITDIFSPTLGTLSFSSWLIITGLIMIIIGIRNHFYGKKLIIDERYQNVINKSSGMTFMFLIYSCLSLFIVGMIKPMKLDLALMSSWCLFATMIVYRISLWYYNKKF